MELEGKVAIVTGGAKLEGIGHAVARGLAREGADIVIGDLYSEGFAAASQSIEALGRRCLCISTDIQDQAQVEVMVERAARFGTIDVLVNAAGGSWAITAEDINRGPDKDRFIGVTNCTPDEWRTIVGVNLEGAFFAARAVAPYFIQQRGGRIVNFSSAAGRTGVPGGYSSSGPYAVAKAGIIGLTKQLAQELAPYGVNVNCVAPGVVESWRLKIQDLPEESQELLKKRIALGRFAKVEEVAEMVVALCTSETSYMTGVTVDINGGMYNA